MHYDFVTFILVLSRRRRQVPPEAQLRPDIPRGPGRPQAVRVQGVRQARAEQVAPLPDALLAGPQVHGLRRRVQPHRHAEDARQEATPHRYTAVLLRYPGQRLAPRGRPASRPVTAAAAAQTDEAARPRPPLMPILATAATAAAALPDVLQQ